MKILAGESWFDSLSKEQQSQYLKDHPQSKMKKQGTGRFLTEKDLAKAPSGDDPLSKALTHKDSRIRHKAISHPAASAEHLDRALTDPDWSVRHAAISHKRASAAQITKALDDPQVDVRMAAITHDKAGPKQIDKALDDEDHDVRYEAVMSSRASLANLEKAAHDKDSAIRSVAQTRIKKLKSKPMFSYLLQARARLQARIKPEDDYDFHVYRGSKPVTVTYRDTPFTIAKGMKFGVRPSSNGKLIRLIFPDNPTRVFTIDLATAKQLAKGL